MKRYLHIWWQMTGYTAQTVFASRLGAVILILGKVIRFVFFLWFLLIIGSKTKVLAGYTLNEMIFFFLTYQLIDTLPQFFMREVYRFRNYVVSGDFDYFLLRPISPLFRSLLGGTDALDIPMIILTIGCLIPSIMQLSFTFLNLVTYILFICNALFIAAAFHILVLSLGILTSEVDNAIMLYRDVTQMGRFPVDIYREPLRGIVTFIVPVGIMMTIPAKALMGIVSPQILILSVAISIILWSLSYYLWQNALKKYGSASS